METAIMDNTMKILLRLRYILLLFWLVQSLGAFADKGSKHPTEDKPDKPRKTLGIPPVVLPNVLKLENGIPINTASKAMMLQNAQLSNALDKAVAQMGDAMSLMDYSDMPAERIEAFVDASTNADRNEKTGNLQELSVFSVELLFPLRIAMMKRYYPFSSKFHPSRNIKRPSISGQ